MYFALMGGGMLRLSRHTVHGLGASLGKRVRDCRAAVARAYIHLTIHPAGLHCVKAAFLPRREGGVFLREKRR